MADAAQAEGAGVDGDPPRKGGSGRIATVALIAAGATSAMASAGTSEPLEIVAVDVSAFPTVVLDVALPDWESAEQLGPEAFSVDGASGLGVERLDPSDLTVAFVLDDGPGVPRTTLAANQGAAIELIRNLPEGVEVGLDTPGGTVVAPSGDRAATMAAISRLNTVTAPDTVTLGPAVVHATTVLEAVVDSRRQLIVMTGDGGDTTLLEVAAITRSLDRSRAAMRVVAIGEDVGSNLTLAAENSGGIAVAIAPDGGPVLRAVDVLTTTLADQYRLTVTMPAPGPLTVRLTVRERVYEMTIPDLRPAGEETSPSSIPSTPASPTSLASATSLAGVETNRRTPAVGPAAGVGPGPDEERPADRSPSSLAGVEAVFGVAAVALVVVVVIRRQRQRRRPRPSSARATGSRPRR